MKYRAAVIGCGMIGSLYSNDPLIKGVSSHAAAYTVCDKTKLIAVCDKDYHKAKEAANKWGIKDIYTDIKNLISDHHPEIISICTPDHAHAEMLTIALNAPNTKAIFAEKPLALDPKAAQKIIKMAKDKNIILAVNYSRRYSLGHRQIKKLLTYNQIGALQSVNGFYTKGILHNGTHWIDLARWLISEISEVQGFSHDLTVDDPLLSGWLFFENNVNGFLVGLDAHAFSLFEMDIIGTLGRIRIMDSGHRIESYKVGNSSYYSGYKTLIKDQFLDCEMENNLLNGVINLVNVLEGKSELFCDGNDGLKALNVAYSLIESAHIQRRVAINDDLEPLRNEICLIP